MCVVPADLVFAITETRQRMLEDVTTQLFNEVCSYETFVRMGLLLIRCQR